MNGIWLLNKSRQIYLSLIILQTSALLFLLLFAEPEYLKCYFFSRIRSGHRRRERRVAIY